MSLNSESTTSTSERMALLKCEKVSFTDSELRNAKPYDPAFWENVEMTDEQVAISKAKIKAEIEYWDEFLRKKALAEEGRLSN